MRRYFPDIDTFKAAAQGADVVPVYRQLLADRLTPVTAFEVLGRDANAFLLESVVGGEQVARYSFIATSPALVYQAYAGRAWITRGNQGFGAPAQEFVTTDPLADLQKLLPRRTYHRDPSLPVFTGGLVGYAGYDTIRYYEGEKLPAAPRDDRKLPDVLFGLYNELVVFDHVDKTIKVIANAGVKGSGFGVQGLQEGSGFRVQGSVGDQGTAPQLNPEPRTLNPPVNPRFKIHAPLIHLTKAQIIRRGVGLGVDYGLTHSCYDPDSQGRACGRCDSCILRKKGFAEAGVPDPTRYAAP